MNRFLLLVALLCSFSAAAAPGIVRTTDSNSFSGEIRISAAGIVVSNSARQTTIPLAKLLRMEMSNPQESAGPRGRGVGLLGYYSANTTPGSPAYVRLDEAVNFAWGQTPPAPHISPETFSVLWAGEIEAPVNGDYSIFLSTEEGARLLLKNQFILERWSKQDFADASITLFLKAGEHLPMRMEYVHSTGSGRARLSWSGPGIPKSAIPSDRLYPVVDFPGHRSSVGAATNGLLATYYEKTDLSGSTFTRIEPGVQFAASNAPVPGLSDTNYSVRWNGQLRADFSESFTFYIAADEGVRFAVNGSTLIDQWNQEGPLDLTQQVFLVAGEKSEIELELKNTQGDARARLEWGSASVPKAIVPTDHLFPSKPPVRATHGDANAKAPIGLALRNGGFVGTKVTKATETQISVGGTLERITFSTVNVARINCQPVSQTMAAKIPAGRTGVLLSNGDFIESDFRRMDDTTVEVSSVLFGLRKYDAKKEVLVIVLRDPKSSAWQYQIRLADQTRLFVGSMALNAEGITLLDPAFASFRLKAAQIRSLAKHTGNTSFAEEASLQ
ncbi:MAG TPA: PA14 domain-containing protein [Candidatus Saccharimonadales bacterium]|nr:PA14 domain-containing protein [Candidatus Saccharimonadales bacterium]